MKCEKSGNHTIFYQSLLLSTIVLNDNYSQVCFTLTVLLEIIYLYSNNDYARIMLAYNMPAHYVWHIRRRPERTKTLSTCLITKIAQKSY